jgi:hypothetical protein
MQTRCLFWGDRELWLLPGIITQLIDATLLPRAAVVLPFIGAIHLGLAMRSHRDIVKLQLGLSVVPPMLVDPSCRCAHPILMLSLSGAVSVTFGA